MGVSRSPAELAAKFTKFERGLLGAQREGVRAGAMLVTTSVRTQLRSVAPSGRLRGVGKRGARVSVGFDNPKSLTNPVALVKARGPWQLIERDTKARTIRPRKRRRGGQSARALAIPGVGVRMSAEHPGTKGKHPWEKGVLRVQRQVLPTVDREVFAAMVKAFR